jgi:hypothetical protein
MTFPSVARTSSIVALTQNSVSEKTARSRLEGASHMRRVQPVKPRLKQLFVILSVCTQQHGHAMRDRKFD